MSPPLPLVGDDFALGKFIAATARPLAVDDDQGELEHELKTCPEPFSAAADGRKRYEVRSTSDRVFKVGQRAQLQEWDPERVAFTGRVLFVRILYVTAAGTWGLPSDLCVFGFEVISQAQLVELPIGGVP